MHATAVWRPEQDHKQVRPAVQCLYIQFADEKRVWSTEQKETSVTAVTHMYTIPTRGLFRMEMVYMYTIMYTC